MKLDEAKEILRKNGYRLNETTAKEHREFFEWKLDFKKELKKLSPRINILKYKDYIYNALMIDILGEDLQYEYEHGTTSKEYAKKVLDWFEDAWNREG